MTDNPYPISYHAYKMMFTRLGLTNAEIDQIAKKMTQYKPRSDHDWVAIKVGRKLYSEGVKADFIVLPIGQDRAIRTAFIPKPWQLTPEHLKQKGRKLVRVI
jgi:hypothetical protein